MNPRAFIVFLSLLFTKSLCLEADPSPIANVTVMGTVFCDACVNNFFSKHSYFLEGVKVRVQCMFRVNSTSREEISITVDRTTDKLGIYKLDIPPVDGFECREGLELDSCCRASLLWSPSLLCNVPGLSSSTEHMAIRGGEGRQCLYNLNALNYRPSKKKDTNLCGIGGEHLPSSMNSSLFFWPPYPPFGFPWPHMPPLPNPFQSSPSLPFPFPSIPFLTPPPPSFPWPFPPLFPTPSPPSFHFPFTPEPNPPAFLPPIPSLFPSPPPPPPIFHFPIPPFPPFAPIPPLFTPPSSPPPPTPSSPFHFPLFPPTIPTPGVPSPPPPTFSLRDPRTWFPHHPPSSSTQP